MSLISRLNPSEGIADFWSEFTKPTPYRWPILGVSLLMTGTLMFLIIREDVVGPPVPPDVTYITSFEADRTDAEIASTNAIYQKAKDQREAYFAAREERKKEIYRALARASGMDPRKIEREAAEQLAAEEAAEARRRAEILNQRADERAKERAQDRALKAAQEASTVPDQATDQSTPQAPDQAPAQ